MRFYFKLNCGPKQTQLFLCKKLFFKKNRLRDFTMAPNSISGASSTTSGKVNVKEIKNIGGKRIDINE